MDDQRRILLLSTSTVFGSGYLAYAEREISEFLGGTKRVLFVPFALHDRDAYKARVRQRFSEMGYELDSLHDKTDMHAAVAAAEALFVGGGNTFRLLKALSDLQLLPAIRARVLGGMPYMGSSAGSNIAGPTIRTTNDMPIVQPTSFVALELVAMQINPHFVDANVNSKHMGETREERIAQFHEENDTPVLGLLEGAMVRVEDGVATLIGTAGARLFRKGAQPVELPVGTSIPEFLLSPETRSALGGSNSCAETS